ncbi:hypothetical protein LOTGIDRAFT_238999 [Lottia gigantea]|uniref:VWFD domain-containing protein n=1 Tax=Lottia gigantea TaxID=225164 RepID=V4A3V6_LOTGI|nr:hypothetical protein LOTGIDRAFT_238999 [Lottia gigantea]ESO98588.1 hypothetical protein LOTGIDRAFT_238999 [Lottia gigantea]
MWLLLYICIGLSLWYTASCQNVSDICKFHSPFSYPDKRLITHNHNSKLSDRFLRAGWYGKEEHMIPSEPPGAGQCGTKYPIYLQERPPNSGAVETVTACVQADDECQQTIEIQAVVCSPTLTVYKLARPSLNGASYCLAPSIEGEFPDFKTKTIIEYKLKDVALPDNSNKTRKEYTFMCAFEDPDDVRLVYKTQWFVDDESVYDSPYTDYKDTDGLRTLTDTRLNAGGITTAGFQLRCEVRPGFTAHQSRIAGLPSRSPSKFIGIEVLNSVITISEGATATIYIRPSVEIGCREKEGCELSVTADIPNVEENEKQCQPTAVANGGCGVIIETENWNVNRNLEISSTTTEEFGQDSIQMKIFLRTDDAYFSQPLWANYFLTPVTINIQKNTTLIEGRKCGVHNDPYVDDFKGRRLTLQLEGTYTLFRSERNVEIQIQTEDCSGVRTGYCVCGVVVRVGRTAFMVNRCNLGYWYIDYVLCDDGADILDVRKRSETYFQMYLPSGSKVDLSLRKSGSLNWLNIGLFPSIRDVGKTSGLCNELNADINKNDDLMETIPFFNQWRVKKEQNMFIPEDYDSIEGIDTSGTFQHCRCNDHDATGAVGKLNCTRINSVTPCVQDTDYTMFHKKRCISPLRRKRSVPGFSQSNIIRHKRLKRLSGTEAFALSSISTVSSQCLYEARMNRTLREEKVEDSKSLLELVKEVSCPGECSDQGRCAKGKCICNTGYIGSDCSVSLNEPPLAHNLEAEGHCDLSVDDCTEVAVFGGRFVEHEKTKCQLNPFEVNQ